ncbi:MAG: hypothetical protein H8E86_05665 [Planctomycetes bacterium]|nr:hypothetical protein [Planctomycetota bacterium]
MQENKTCHQALVIPTQYEAQKISAHAARRFQRVLASWASDLFILKKEVGIEARKIAA